MPVRLMSSQSWNCGAPFIIPRGVTDDMSVSTDPNSLPLEGVSASPGPEPKTASRTTRRPAGKLPSSAIPGYRSGSCVRARNLKDPFAGDHYGTLHEILIPQPRGWLNSGRDHGPVSDRDRQEHEAKACSRRSFVQPRGQKDVTARRAATDVGEPHRALSGTLPA